MKHWQALPRRTKFLILLLCLLGGLYGLSLVESARISQTLQQTAQKEIDGLRHAQNDLAWLVTASRPFILFGDANGTVEVFVRQKDGGDTPSIHSVSFYYVWHDDQWKLDGSGASAGEESQRKGLKVFAEWTPPATATAASQAP